MKKRHLTEVQDWMREHPVTIDPDATLSAAQELMLENEVRRLPVVERGELVGIITNSDILRQIPATSPAHLAARRVLRAFGPEAPNEPAPQPMGGLVEPLTARELDVLRLIAAGLRNQEIADQLFISLPTVKRHLANAYGKLEASHRTEAVARARALHLL